MIHSVESFEKVQKNSNGILITLYYTYTNALEILSISPISYTALICVLCALRNLMRHKANQTLKHKTWLSPFSYLCLSCTKNNVLNQKMAPLLNPFCFYNQ